MSGPLHHPMACNKWGQSKILVIVVGGRVWDNFTLTPDITQMKTHRYLTPILISSTYKIGARYGP